MTYIAKPKFQHPGLPKNGLGFTHRDYEGKISTLCAGCEGWREVIWRTITRHGWA